MGKEEQKEYLRVKTRAGTYFQQGWWIFGMLKPAAFFFLITFYGAHRLNIELLVVSQFLTFCPSVIWAVKKFRVFFFFCLQELLSCSSCIVNNHLYPVFFLGLNHFYLYTNTSFHRFFPETYSLIEMEILEALMRIGRRRGKKSQMEITLSVYPLGEETFCFSREM